jgi:hypothetical protein
MRPVIAVLVVSLVAGSPAACGNTRVASAPVASRAPAPVELTMRSSKPREASDAEREKYAERETKSSGLEKFKGGDAGVVTVLLVVVLVILILVLLKKI